MRESLLVCALLCSCGVAPVEELPRRVVDVDAGRPDAGSFDAGSFDAGEPTDGGCLGALPLLPNYDVISVQGTIGPLGDVDYVLGSSGAGIADTTGVQRFIDDDRLSLRVPTGVLDTGLWTWTGAGPVVIGITYEADNVGQFSGGDPFLNFRVHRVVSCPEGEGRGRFTFSRFIYENPGTRHIEGEYEFDCPDAGIAVQGCFRYLE